MAELPYFNETIRNDTTNLEHEVLRTSSLCCLILEYLGISLRAASVISKFWNTTCNELLDPSVWRQACKLIDENASDIDIFFAYRNKPGSTQTPQCMWRECFMDDLSKLSYCFSEKTFSLQDIHDNGVWELVIPGEDDGECYIARFFQRVSATHGDSLGVYVQKRLIEQDTPARIEVTFLSPKGAEYNMKKVFCCTFTKQHLEWGIRSLFPTDAFYEPASTFQSNEVHIKIKIQTYFGSLPPMTATSNENEEKEEEEDVPAKDIYLKWQEYLCGLESNNGWKWESAGNISRQEPSLTSPAARRWLDLWEREAEVPDLEQQPKTRSRLLRVLRQHDWDPFKAERYLMEKRHVGVNCDVCHTKSFKGRRFKCTSCRNYDLCEECFSQERCSKAHKVEHSMMNIPPYILISVGTKPS